jgi:hypothetical protein
MREMVVSINDIPKTLEPFFGNQCVRIIIEDKGAVISVDNPDDKVADKIKPSARGVLREFANPDMIPGEKGAWERAVAERYAKEQENNS